MVVERIDTLVHGQNTFVGGSRDMQRAQNVWQRLGGLFRKWRIQYGEQWKSKFRQRHEIEMIQKYDTHFYIGTVAKDPGNWIYRGLILSATFPPVWSFPVRA
jgi:hypothetical protein